MRADLRHAVELFNHIYLGQEASPAASVCFNMSLKMVGIVGEFEMTTNSCLLSPSTTCFLPFYSLMSPFVLLIAFIACSCMCGLFIIGVFEI